MQRTDSDALCRLPKVLFSLRVRLQLFPTKSHYVLTRAEANEHFLYIKMCMIPSTRQMYSMNLLTCGPANPLNLINLERIRSK